MAYKLLYQNRINGATAYGVQLHPTLADAEQARRDALAAVAGAAVDVAPVLVVDPTTRGVGLAPETVTKADMQYLAEKRRKEREHDAD